MNVVLAYVTNEAELLAVMGEGQKNRAVAATGMNEGSSRSHSVFFIELTQVGLAHLIIGNRHLFKSVY